MRNRREPPPPNPRLTVRDLIEQLSELDPDLGVLVEGYEGGYTTPRLDEVTTYRREDWQHASGLFGEFDEDAQGDYRAVLLTRDVA